MPFGRPASLVKRLLGDVGASDMGHRAFIEPPKSLQDIGQRGSKKPKAPENQSSGALEFYRASLPKAPQVVHMWSIMTWPKPEQLTWVAPSMRRAKS